MTARPSAAAVLKIDESRAVEQIAANLRRIREDEFLHAAGVPAGT